MRIVGKLAIAFLVVALVPIMILGYLSYSTAKDALEKQALEDLTVIAEAKEGHLYSFLEGIKARVIDFSSDGFILDRAEELQRLDPAEPRYAELQAALDRHLKQSKLSLDETLHAIAVIDSGGRTIAATEAGGENRDESSEDYFVYGKTGVYVSDVHPSTHLAVSEHPYHIAVSAPLFSREKGALVGVIVNFYDTHELDKMLSGEFQVERGALSGALGRRGTMDIYVVNRAGLLLTSSRLGGEVMKQRVETFPVQECAAGRETTAVYKNYLGKEVIGASMCIPSNGWTLLVEIDTKEAFAPVAALEKRVVSLGIAAALLAVFLAYFIAYGISRPVIHLSEATEKIAAGDFSAQASVETKDEVGELASSFNEMAAQLEERTRNLEKKVMEFRGLYEISDLFKGEFELERVGDEVTKKIAELMNAEQCCIILYDKESMEFNAASPAYGMKKEQLEMLRFSLEDSDHLFEHWEEKEPLISSEPVRDARLMGGLKGMFNEQNLLLAKLLVAGEFLGIMRLANKRAGSFSTEDTKLVEIISSRLGAAFHAGKLFSKLQESEERHRGLVETSLDAIIGASEKGTITTWNSAAERIFGYSAADAIGKSLTILMPEEYRKRHTAGLERFLRTEKPRIIGTILVLEALRRDGTRFPIEMSLSARKEGERYAFTSVIRDITEKKKAEEELKKYSKDLEEANRLKDLFTDIMRHDLQNPVTVIKGLSGILGGGKCLRT